MRPSGRAFQILGAQFSTEQKNESYSAKVILHLLLSTTTVYSIMIGKAIKIFDQVSRSEQIIVASFYFYGNDKSLLDNVIDLYSKPHSRTIREGCHEALWSAKVLVYIRLCYGTKAARDIDEMRKNSIDV